MNEEGAPTVRMDVLAVEADARTSDGAHGEIQKLGQKHKMNDPKLIPNDLPPERSQTYERMVCGLLNYDEEMYARAKADVHRMNALRPKVGPKARSIGDELP